MTGEGELLQHLHGLTGLEVSMLGKILDEIRAWYGDDLVAWTRRRHAELQKQGMRNDEIYALLRHELHLALFSGGDRSTRQVRRMIYG